MRLWTVHPRYLDARGLVAAWREALLARKVLAGETKGYRHHPQLARFRSRPEPIPVVGAYLAGLADEARRRGYRFDRTKIPRRRFTGRIEETAGQLRYEWYLLKSKLQKRDPVRYRACAAVEAPEAHPLFRIVPGRVQTWEKIRKNLA